MDIRISTNKFVRFLFTVLTVILTGSLFVQWIGLRTGHWRLGGLNSLFNLDGDLTLPTWYNSFLLALLSLTTWSISDTILPKVSGGQKRWRFLSFVFLLMAIDEVAMVHETFGAMVTKHFHATHYLYFGFALPGSLLALALFTAYLPFLRSLPRRTAWGMVAAGALYVAAAAGVESVSGNSYYLYGGKQAAYLLLTDLEEFLEMASLIYLLKVLLDYLRSLPGGAGTEWRLRLEP